MASLSIPFVSSNKNDKHQRYSHYLAVNSDLKDIEVNIFKFLTYSKTCLKWTSEVPNILSPFRQVSAFERFSLA